jgi:hypothetical protein
VNKNSINSKLVFVRSMLAIERSDFYMERCIRILLFFIISSFVWNLILVFIGSIKEEK